MKNMVSRTGGICIIQEEFQQQVFQDSFRNIFALNEFEEMKVASGGRIKVHVSPPLKIKGAIGPCLSLKNKFKSASAEPVGEGETNEWYLGGLDPCLTLTHIYEIDAKEQAAKKRSNAFFQFVTTYKHPSGHIFKRVTSISRPFMNSTNNI